jgi:hypothetical protein
MQELKKAPLRRAHFVGTSVVVTIDQCHVKRLGIDDLTFFIQKSIENGIVLEMRKLTISTTKENNVKSSQSAQVGSHVQTAAAENPPAGADGPRQ